MMPTRVESKCTFNGIPFHNFPQGFPIFLFQTDVEVYITSSTWLDILRIVLQRKDKKVSSPVISLIFNNLLGNSDLKSIVDIYR